MVKSLAVRPLLEQTLFLAGTGEGVQHTVAAIQKSQQRLGFLGGRRRWEEKVEMSSALTWSAPVVKRGTGYICKNYTSVKLNVNIYSENMIIL